MLHCQPKRDGGRFLVQGINLQQLQHFSIPGPRISLIPSPLSLFSLVFRRNSKRRIGEMARTIWLWIVCISILGAGLVEQSLSLGVGVNYGQIANNLPSPTRAAALLQSLGVTKVKLYDADPNVLSAFAGSNVQFVVCIPNSLIPSLSQSPTLALSWVQANIQPYISQVSCITVGNEIFTYNDSSLMSNLVPAMQNIHSALVSLSLSDRVNVSSAHSVAFLSSSYPPSSGVFREDLVQYIQPLLNFHSQTGSPILINAYPFFAYKGNPSEVSLDYVLFQPNQGIIDPGTNLHYDNMLYAQIDAVYAAMKVMGRLDVEVRVSETGWPSKGDADEVGATPENAGIYNGNLFRRIQMKQGTPMRPTVPLDTYVFALFNEDLKPGPTSERNYGLFYPDGTPVYNVGFAGLQMDYSRADWRRNQISWSLVMLSLLLIVILGA